MNYKISKELFEDVMEYKCEFIDIRTNIIVAFSKNSALDMIHIDSFFFKCKEWAFKNGYELLSSSKFKGKQLDGLCQIYLNAVVMNRFKQLIISDSEQQAVFDAAQWILENK